MEKPRHIEIQLLADKYGRVIHLGERDCSIQRRHQKLLEESPSPAVDSKLRKKLGETAVKAAKEVKYSSAGTIEFLMDEKKNFYFMEMNTRIQVEHPVTELVTGIDIVKEQIKLAYGEKLKIQQDDVKINGSSIECRINAEDYQNNFMPSPGRIEVLNLPGGPGVRIDSHAYQGYTVSQYYDSLIAKLIVWGRDRKEAIQVMRRSLDEFTIEPIKTTISFHREVLKNPFFVKGEFSTNFINEHFKSSPQERRIIMRTNSKTDNPAVKIHKNVIASIAARAAMEIEGVQQIGRSPIAAIDIRGLLGIKNVPRVKVDFNKNDEIKIEIPLIVKYGYNIPVIAESAQENIRQAIEKMLDKTPRESKHKYPRD